VLWLLRDELNAVLLYVGEQEHDYSSGAEFGTQKTVKSEVPDTGVCETDGNSMQAAEVTGVSSRAPARPSVQYKVRKAYSCDICPYSATNFAAVLGHKKLHVKRPGYSYECSVCPSHSKLRMNRETGCGCHIRLLCFYVCVCIN